MPKNQHDRLQKLLAGIDDLPVVENLPRDRQAAKSARAVISAALDRHDTGDSNQSSNVGWVSTLARIGSSQTDAVRKTYSSTKKVDARKPKSLMRKLAEKRTNKSKKD